MKYFKKIGISLLAILVIVIIFVIWNSNKTERKILSIVNNFDFNNPESVNSISEISKLREKAIPALQDLINSQSSSERYVSVIAMSGILTDNENLSKTITSILKQNKDEKDDNLRMLVGVTLLSFGEKEGIPILISCLDSKENVRFSEPPELVKERSLAYLVQYTDYDGVNRQKWENWWVHNRSFICWDRSKKIFELNLPY